MNHHTSAPSDDRSEARRNRARPSRLLAVIAVMAGTAAALTGCASTGSAAPATATVTRASSATPSPTTSTTPTPSASTGQAMMCSSSQLTGQIGEQDGKPAGSGAATDQEHLAVILTNTSTTACTLQGWPGVSFVGDSNGTQIGAAATLDRTAPHPTVTLQHGAAAQAYITILAAATYQAAACQPVTPDGFRVYPPGSKTSLFITGAGAGDGQVCANVKYGLLTTDAFIPYP